MDQERPHVPLSSPSRPSEKIAPRPSSVQLSDFSIARDDGLTGTGGGTRRAPPLSALEKLRQLPTTLAEIERPPFLSKNRLLDPEAIEALDRTLPGKERVIVFGDLNNLRVANEYLGRERVTGYIASMKGLAGRVSQELKTPSKFFRLGGDEICGIAGNLDGSGIALFKKFFEDLEIVRFGTLEAATAVYGVSSTGESLAARRTMIKATVKSYYTFCESTGQAIGAEGFREWLLRKAENEGGYTEEQIAKLRSLQSPEVLLAALITQLARRTEALGTASVGGVIVSEPLSFNLIVDCIGAASEEAMKKKALGLPGFHPHSLLTKIPTTPQLRHHRLAWNKEKGDYSERKNGYNSERAAALLSNDEDSAIRAMLHFAQDPGLGLAKVNAYQERGSEILRYEILEDYKITLRQLGLPLRPSSTGITQIGLNIEGFGCFNTYGGYSCGDGLFQALTNQVRERLALHGLMPSLLLRKGGGELIALCEYSGVCPILSKDTVRELSQELRSLVISRSAEYEVRRENLEIANIGDVALDLLSGKTRISPNTRSPQRSTRPPEAGTVTITQSNDLILPL